MQKFYRVPFATAGDLAAVPDATQGDGSVSNEQGYGPDYALDPSGGDPAKRIERDQYNQILLSVTTAIQEQQTKGLPDHITAALNNGSPFAYEIGASVFQPIDDKVYRNTAAANVTVPPNAGWLDITTPLTLATLPDASTSQKGIVQLVNSVGTSLILAPTQNLINTINNLKANIASPTFTGNPKSVTPATGDNDTSIATTAYVKANVALRALLAGSTSQVFSIASAGSSLTRAIRRTDRATATLDGTIRVRLSGTTLFMTNNGSNP